MIQRSRQPFCLAGGTARQLGLLFERNIRVLLKNVGPRERIRIGLPCGSKPLQEVQALLRQRLPEEAMGLIGLRHGKRFLATDDDIRYVLHRTQEASSFPVLRVSAAEGCEEAIEALAPEKASERPVASVVTTGAFVNQPHQMLSFYCFCQIPERRLSLLEQSLSLALQEAAALGTVYLASEGINGQIAVPRSQLSPLQQALARVPEMAGVKLNHGKVSTIPFVCAVQCGVLR